MDDILVTPNASTFSRSGGGPFDTETINRIWWTATAQTMRAKTNVLTACPRTFPLHSKQAMLRFPDNGYSTAWGPVSSLGVVSEYKPEGAAATEWYSVARRVVTDPTFSAAGWSGGELETVRIASLVMLDHMDIPCTFEIDAASAAAIPSWAYDIAPTHHGWQGLYSADATGIRSDSVMVPTAVHRSKWTGGHYRRVGGNTPGNMLFHVPTRDLIGGVGFENNAADILGSHAHLAETSMHRDPGTFRYRAYSTLSVPTGDPEPSPPSDARVDYYYRRDGFPWGTMTYPVQSLYVPYIRSGGMFSAYGMDLYGYVADATIDPDALSPPAGAVAFRIVDPLNINVVIEQKLPLNFPYCASCGTLSPSVYFPGRGIRLGNIAPP